MSVTGVGPTDPGRTTTGQVSSTPTPGQVSSTPTPGSFTMSAHPLPATKIVSCSKSWSLEKRGEADGQLDTPTDVAFLQNGDLVVSELENERLQMFDMQGEAVAVLAEGEIRPRGVAVDSMSNIWITDEMDGTVKMFAINGQQRSAWRKAIFRKPHGIAILPSDLIVVTDIHQNSPQISIFEPDGRKVRDFSLEADRTDNMGSPAYVDVDQQGRIIVSDHANHCVKIFDERGKKLAEFGGRGRKDGHLYYPNGVAVDVHDNIFVADNGNHRVSLYSSVGKFIQHIVTRDDQVVWPEGVSVSHLGLLAVTENGIDNDALKVYQM